MRTTARKLARQTALHTDYTPEDEDMLELQILPNLHHAAVREPAVPFIQFGVPIPDCEQSDYDGDDSDGSSSLCPSGL